jgi:hypothetical protein
LSLVDESAAPGGVALHVLALDVSEAGSLFLRQSLPSATEPSVQGVANLNQGWNLTFCSFVHIIKKGFVPLSEHFEVP